MVAGPRRDDEEGQRQARPATRGRRSASAPHAAREPTGLECARDRPRPISQLWSDFLGFISTLVIPDWASLIALLPLFVLVGVVGPLLSLAVLGLARLLVTKPRVKVRYDGGHAGRAARPLGDRSSRAGEPYCPRDGLIYPSGATRCDRDKTSSLAALPEVRGRPRGRASTTCGNCGLVARVKRGRARHRPTDGPPPGGAAVA